MIQMPCGRICNDIIWYQGIELPTPLVRTAMLWPPDTSNLMDLMALSKCATKSKVSTRTFVRCFLAKAQTWWAGSLAQQNLARGIFCHALPPPPRALHQDHGILQWFQQMPRPYLPAAAMVVTLWPGDLGSPAAKPFRNMEDLRAVPSCAPPCDAPAPGSIAGIASMLPTVEPMLELVQWAELARNTKGSLYSAAMWRACQHACYHLKVASISHPYLYQSYHFHFSTTLRTPTSRQSPSPGPTCNAQLCSSY